MTDVVSTDKPAPKAGTSLLWALLESGGMSVLSLVTLLVLARLIGPHELGIGTLALAVVQFFALIGEMLMHDALVQRPKLDNRHIDTAFWTSVAFGGLMLCLCVIGAGPFATLFGEPELAPVMIVMATALVFGSVSGVPMALMRRDGEFRALALRTLIGRTAAAVAAIAVALGGGGVWAIVAQQIAQPLVAVIMVWSVVRWRPSLDFCGTRLRELLLFALPSISGRLMWVFALRLFTVVYGYFFGVVAAGFLNIAQRVVDTLYDTLGGAAYNTALPFFSRSQKDRPAFFETCRIAMELTAVSTLPIFAGLAICAPSIVAVFLGEEWREAAPFIRVFAVGAMFQFLLLLPNVALVAAGRPGAILVLASMSFVFVFGGLLLVHPDSFGAVVIWSLRVVATAPMVALYMYWLFNDAAKGLISGSLVPLAAVIVMAGVLTAVQTYALAGLSDIVLLLVLVPFGVVVYVLFIGLVSRSLTARLTDLTMSSLRGLRAS